MSHSPAKLVGAGPPELVLVLLLLLLLLPLELPELPVELAEPLELPLPLLVPVDVPLPLLVEALPLVPLEVPLAAAAWQWRSEPQTCPEGHLPSGQGNGLAGDTGVVSRQAERPSAAARPTALAFLIADTG
jgi:hypothetical protein